MADELPYVLDYLALRVADAVAGAGIPRRRVHLDGPPQGASTEASAAPFVVVQLQGGGANLHASAGRALSEPVVTVKVVSGGDAFTVGSVAEGYRPQSVRAVLDAIQEALEEHRATVATGAGESAHVTVKGLGPVRMVEQPATSGGVRWMHQGRQWRVMIRPTQRAYS